MFAHDSIRCVTRPENFSRSTANAPPAGTLDSFAHESISESESSSSSLRIPEAVMRSLIFSEPNELLHTISASIPVLCAGVKRLGRISYSETSQPRFES